MDNVYHKIEERRSYSPRVLIIPLVALVFVSFYPVFVLQQADDGLVIVNGGIVRGREGGPGTGAGIAVGDKLIMVSGIVIGEVFTRKSVSARLEFDRNHPRRIIRACTMNEREPGQVSCSLAGSS